jgi:hypothetical protein
LIPPEVIAKVASFSGRSGLKKIYIIGGINDAKE